MLELSPSPIEAGHLAGTVRPPTPRRGSRTVRAAAAEPVSGASLAVFRAVYGLAGLLSVVRILANGWVDSLYAAPVRHFHYPGLHWVGAPGPTGMRVLLAVVGVAAVLVAVGWHHRSAMAVFLVGFGWLESIDATTYLNHYWFMTAVGVAMLVAPMAAAGSLDARRRGARRVPRGVVWFFRAQVAVVYGFAGLAKLRPTWLVDAMPLRLWLPAHADVAVIGPLLARPSTALVASWAGAAFDCTIVGFLLWRRTRLGAWFVVVAFHLVTGLLFPIGVFPLLMVGATLVFFAPDWPSRLLRRLARSPRDEPSDAARSRARSRARPAVGLPGWAVAAMLAMVVLHVLVPFRHVLYPGDAHWTGEAYRFSWNVLLTEKSGSASFRVTDRTTGRTHVTAADDLYTPLQLRAMATEPELVRQAAHAIADDEAAAGRSVEVRADVFVSLDGRPAARLIDPTVDLAAEPGRLTAQPWILPAPTSHPSG